VRLNIPEDANNYKISTMARRNKKMLLNGTRNVMLEGRGKRFLSFYTAETLERNIECKIWFLNPEGGSNMSRLTDYRQDYNSFTQSDVFRCKNA
jgi:hypothetical protein